MSLGLRSTPPAMRELPITTATVLPPRTFKERERERREGGRERGRERGGREREGEERGMEREGGRDGVERG